MVDNDLLDEFKAKVIDRFTAAELVDLLDISIEDLLEIQEIMDRVVDSALIQEEVCHI